MEDQTRLSEKHRRTAERVEVRLKETDNEREALVQKLHETETKLRNAEKLVRDKEGEVESKERSQKRLEEKLSRLETENNALETRNRTHEEQIKALQKQLKETEKAAEEIQTRPRSGSKRQIEEFAANIQAEKELLNRKIGELEKKLQEKEEELNKLRTAATVTPIGGNGNGAATSNGAATQRSDAGEQSELERVLILFLSFPPISIS